MKRVSAATALAVSSYVAASPACSSSSALTASIRTRGDFGFNHIHSSNPQHGGSYARHERALNEGELEDFLKSVKGWSRDVETNAIWRSVYFETFGEAYRFMGRLYAFCYASDRYPPVTWEGTRIDIQLYSPTFKGLTRSEARIAAFVNDQMNMLKKGNQQRSKLLEVAEKSSVHQFVRSDDEKQQEMIRSKASVAVPEVSNKLRSWKDLV
jgi:pterin-4a-carbinolamine dehydratase